MHMEEWEYLPDARFLDLNQEDDDKKILSSKRSTCSKSVFDMDDYYFICPSPRSPTQKMNSDSPRTSEVPKQLLPVPLPMHLEPNNIGQADNYGDQSEKDFTNKVFHTEVSVVPSVLTEKIKASTVGADQDTFSQVFFKMKDSEFVDMKMDSPKSGTKGLLYQTDAGRYRFDDREDPLESKSSPRMKTEVADSEIEKHIMTMDSDDDRDKEKVAGEEVSGGVSLWKWTLTGFGAICSFGFAATICILYFGNQYRNKVQQNQKIRFQIYADDKSIKRAMQHATKLDEAISAARGFPLGRAQITLGGYYDGI